MKFSSVAAVAVALAGLAGCSTHVSRDITPEGQAGEVVFPALETAVIKDGTFPGVEALTQVGEGMDKDQLYRLLGRPHFREGFARVREWDYLFHFRQNESVRTCQYKVIFNENYRVGSTHWSPRDCSELLTPAAATQVVADGHASGLELLQTRVQFAFSKSTSADLTDDGQARIRELAGQLKSAPAIELVEVLGYADRIGASPANVALSQARAETVRSLLIAEGVPAERIRSIGLGNANSTADCARVSNQQALRQCLAPDRRVDVRAHIRKQ